MKKHNSAMENTVADISIWPPTVGKKQLLFGFDKQFPITTQKLSFWRYVSSFLL